MVFAICFTAFPDRADAQSGGDEMGDQQRDDGNHARDGAAIQAFQAAAKNLRDLKVGFARISQLLAAAQTADSPGSRREAMTGVSQQVQSLGPAVRNPRTYLVRLEIQTGKDFGSRDTGALASILNKMGEEPGDMEDDQSMIQFKIQMATSDFQNA